jgi:hypothetical protein
LGEMIGPAIEVNSFTCRTNLEIIEDLSHSTWLGCY